MDGKRKALGRGIGALIPGGGRPAVQRTDGEAPSWAAIEAIAHNPYQPREAFDESRIDELAASIREKGLLQPLLVRRSANGFQLIAGERRFRAAQKAGLSKVPISIRDADDSEMLELALIENVQREDLNPIEEARAYRRLASDFGLGHEDIARRVGKTRSTVSNALRLLSLPAKVIADIESGAISAGHARSLLGLESPDSQAELAQDVGRRGLSVRETERLVRARVRPIADVEQRAVESRLSQALGTRVRLHHSKSGAGRIEIEYYSLDELNGLLDRLTARSKEPEHF